MPVGSTAWGSGPPEVVGLRVQDVLVLHAEIHMVQAVKRRGGEVQVGTPKSKRSSGLHVPIPPALARQLADHIAACGLGPDDYVFTSRAGNYSSFYKHLFKPATRTVGLPTLRFHDLRHTFAAPKLGQGYGIHELKEWMGEPPLVPWRPRR
jgi:integrase